MEKRKNPEKDLRNKSGLFFQIGLLMAMMLCVSAFEYRTEAIDPLVCHLPVAGVDAILPPVITEHDIPKPPKPKITPKFDPTRVKAGEPEPGPIDPEWVEREPLLPAPTFVDDMPDEPVVEDPLFIFVESMPEPIGGYSEFYQYVAKHLKYPAKARRMSIEGKVYVQFIVNVDGSLTDFSILKSIGAGCDEEVIRIMNNAPKWTPGKQRGVPVRVKQVLPISFQLN